jgi:hypothetical protein
MNAVPFTLGHLYAGLGQCEGLLRDEGDNVCLEFQVKDAVAGIIKTGVRELRIPLKDLVSVTLTKGWLGNTWLGVKITLQAARLETLKDMPGASQGRLELSIARKDRDAAERFVAGLHEQGGAGEK